MITSEVFAAYSQCILKAYLLLYERGEGTPHEYISILEKKAKKNRNKYLKKLGIEEPLVKPFSQEHISSGTPFLIEANLIFKDLHSYADVLCLVKKGSRKMHSHYIPSLVVGTNRISKEQKLQLGFSGYVLSKLQSETATSGTIIGVENNTHRIQLLPLYNGVESIINELRKWTDSQFPERPPIILNRHCILCPFRESCEAKAKESDSLSLLNKISTIKQIKKYERKGIFTVNQLSYLYRPRRQRKRSRNPPSVQHSLELQALVLRVGKIYLHTSPELLTSRTELFLDFEGMPDRQYYYLVGVLIRQGDNSNHHSLWANDTRKDEQQIWLQLVEIFRSYSDCPIYHYGSYDAKAVATLGNRYGTDTDEILKRLVNINDYIYGKIYFPVRSNSLKDIGHYIGATWTSPNASGLQSLVWRHHWEDNRELKYKHKLITYNHEDCKALMVLMDFLRTIKEREDSVLDIDSFVYSKKTRSSKTKNPIHYQLESMLKFAHVDYDKKKINFRAEKEIKKIRRKKSVRREPLKKYRRVTKVIQVPKASECRHCGCKDLKQSKKKNTERIKVDLVFSKNGIRKSVIKYLIPYSLCQKCKRYSKSAYGSKTGRPKLYGYGFKVWIAYQRIALRLSYQNIILAIEDMFNETVPSGAISVYLREVAHNYGQTEEKIIRNLLASPFLHVDETPINIDNINQFVWGFTDGKNVIFKYTATRDASFVHEFLGDYTGILISDFYTGYDALGCKHQKCLVHLIRDLNNDLWSNAFDVELGDFVSKVRDLLTPIMETIQQYGLKKRNLNKFRKTVDNFYVSNIDNRSYKSDFCSKFQNRFVKYRESLFTFLVQDNIPWHNNPIENALRAITLQLDISKVLHEPVIEEYLMLLSIKQTCKYQEKSFLKFLLSEEKDVDLFKGSKSRKLIYINN
jgi:predicted RecB family nuclease